MSGTLVLDLWGSSGIKGESQRLTYRGGLRSGRYKDGVGLETWFVTASFELGPRW